MKELDRLMLSPRGEDISESKKRIQAELKASKQKGRTEFPLDAFPPACQEFIRGYCDTFGAPTEHYGLAMLTVAGTIIGNACWIEERGNAHPPLLYSIVVDKPSTGKTPIIKTVLKPVFKIEKEYRKQHAAALREAAAEEEEKEPKAKEAILNEFTLEAVFRVLFQNPRGLLIFRDEIRGWLQSMNQYRKGSDEVFYLESWNGSTVKINRVGNKTLFIDRPFAAVLGTTQPEILKHFAQGDKAHNGFLARLLFSYPDDSKKQAYSTQEVDSAHQERWECLIRRLHALPVNSSPPKDEYDDWTIEPHMVGLDKQAKAVYQAFFDNNATQINESDDEIIQAILGKFDSYTLRFALILELMNWAETGPDDPQYEDVIKIRVGKKAMQNAIRLTNYFRATALKVVNRLAGPVESLPEVQRIWYEHLPEEFTRAEALDLAKDAGVSARQMGRLFTRSDLFKRVRQGVYWKNFV